MNFKKVIQEPFFHFIILGLLLYMYYDVMRDENTQVSKKVISVSSYDIAHIQTSFEKLWHRKPHKAELDALIQERYNEQILLDEALVLELEKNDRAISTRLIEKMQHIMMNTERLEEPTEAMLEAYYKQHLYAYAKPDHISFSHVYYQSLNPEQERQMSALFQSQGIEPKDANLFGDTFEHAHHIVDMNYSTCKAEFGNYFTQQIYKLMPKQWHGPVRSKLGIHFIYVDETTSSEIYPFDEVEYRVYQDYLHNRKAKAYHDAFGKISQQYELKRE